MRLTVVGSAGSYPGPDSPASCYLLEADHGGRTWRVLLDAGSGSLGPLQHHVDPLDLDGVLLSHLHPDHYFDLSGHYVLRRYHPAGPRPPIPVWGPAGTEERVTVAYGLPRDGMRDEFRFHAYEGEPVALGPFTVRALPVQHPVAAYALRIEADGTVLTYSGDTGPCRGLVEAARGAELFLCEAAFREGGDNPPDLHLTGREAGEAAVAAAVGRLVLTHVPAWYDPEDARREAVAVYGGPVDLATPGATWEIGAPRPDPQSGADRTAQPAR